MYCSNPFNEGAFQMAKIVQLQKHKFGLRLNENEQLEAIAVTFFYEINKILKFFKKLIV